MIITGYQEMMVLEEKINTLERVSGLSIDTLISLFASGYELTEPPKPMTVSELVCMFSDRK